ncbi:MAG: lipoyl(octanoyl) transferase LipB [Solirubrobacteraceae bacterium]|nr:lipoyl(octanoyl) transferase LipB [Solirubrobacteraceae bacterium]
MTEELWVCHLPVIEYRAALALQERVRSARQENRVPDTLLALEHPRVYTRGRRSDPSELPLGEDWYRDQGIDIVDTARGGKLTYHGPGQLVGYPIMRIDDVVAYLRTMERAIVGALGEIGVSARSRPDEGPDYTGVWIAERKIASIGVHVARGVTTHGFAINVDNDLEPFGWVVACGLGGVQMTSVAVELAADAGGAAGSLHAVRERVTAHFAAAYDRDARAISFEALTAALGDAPEIAANALGAAPAPAPAGPRASA